MAGQGLQRFQGDRSPLIVRGESEALLAGRQTEARLRLVFKLSKMGQGWVGASAAAGL